MKHQSVKLDIYRPSTMLNDKLISSFDIVTLAQRLHESYKSYLDQLTCLPGRTDGYIIRRIQIRDNIQNRSSKYRRNVIGDQTYFHI